MFGELRAVLPHAARPMVAHGALHVWPLALAATVARVRESSPPLPQTQSVAASTDGTTAKRPTRIASSRMARL